MINHRTTTALVVLVLCAQPVLAQDTLAYRRLVEQYSMRLQFPSACPAGPGTAFGVTAYQCASCSYQVDQQDDAGTARQRRAYTMARSRPYFGFQSEPIVLETTPNSLLKAGDVIVSVNSQPITTRAGSDAFTYPAAGDYVIRVRRAGSNVDITVRSGGACLTGYIFQRFDTASVPNSAAGRRGRGSGSGPGTERLLDEMVVTSNRPFGFGVSCQPSCPRTRARDGTDYYYKFDGYPPVVGVTRGGIAEQAGLREGDRIVEIDGLSILGEEGALRFLRMSQHERLNLTVLRNGERLEYTLSQSR